jgi:ribonuclease E
MPENQPPAEPIGGDADISARPELADLPAKLRVHVLAKRLGRASRDVVAALEQRGIAVKSAQSSIDRDTALQVGATLLGPTEKPGTDTGEETGPPDDAATHSSAPPLFLQPEPAAPQPRRAPTAEEPTATEPTEHKQDAEEQSSATSADGDADEGSGGGRRRRRGRRGRGRGKGGGSDEQAPDTGTEAGGGSTEQTPGTAGSDTASSESEQSTGDEDGDAEGTGDGARRRRRRRRRKSSGGEAGDAGGDPPDTVVHVREPRPAAAESAAEDEVRSVRGSTRLEAKRQRRRDGRDAGRRRTPVLSEAEFLARRESVERSMVVREDGQHGQIAALEDGVLVEHFVTAQGHGSLVGNIYLGKVQNVLPSMEAAFVDIGRGRNAVLYAGEVDWDAAGLAGKARKIEQALSSEDKVLVQVSKDPVGHKGARLTTQISLPGRFLVYVPGGGATGISRKLPDGERKRLKDILKQVVPSDAGVIVRTAAEGVGADELARDVERLRTQWETVEKSSGSSSASAPELLHQEPNLLIKVVRDLFTEDFSELVVQGEEAWQTIQDYVGRVAPDLSGRLRKHVANTDVFADYRVDEHLAKALDRKVWLPSGGTLIIDRTEAMTVIDVNTGKFTGSGGNLEETVTRNNLEAAEELVRQLRLRDIGGMIVIDFIDMVLETNRDLVLRRLTECLGRDRTRHQVAEVTSLGLVQMTRKRLGTGLLESFSQPCAECGGRGVLVSSEPVAASAQGGSSGRRGGSSGRRHRGSARRAAVAADTPESDSDEEKKTAERIAALSMIHEKAAQPAAAAVTEPGAASDDGAETSEAQARSADEAVAAAEATAAVESVEELESANLGGAEHTSNGAIPAESAETVASGVARASRRRAASRPAGPPPADG